MRYLIIGLGIYGSNLARDLTAMGHEVIGADSNPAAIEAIKDYISTVYHIDSTEEGSLAVLPLRNVDVVIVAIGENFGASVRTVALLKQAQVRQIYARAIDPLHQAILQSFNIARILTPEQRAAADLTHEMALGTHVDILGIDTDTIIARFAAPAFLIGQKYSELRLADRYGLTLIAATRPTARHDLLGNPRTVPKALPVGIFADKDTTGDLTVTDGDILVMAGAKKKFDTLYRDLQSL